LSLKEIILAEIASKEIRRKKEEQSSITYARSAQVSNLLARMVMDRSIRLWTRVIRDNVQFLLTATAWLLYERPVSKSGKRWKRRPPSIVECKEEIK